MNGEIPENIEEVFEYAGVSLFPKNDMDLITSCSCLDFANPCKHIAAVILYLARVLDYNPFLLLELRGKSKTEILNDLILKGLDEGTTHKKEEKISMEENKEFEFKIPQIKQKRLRRSGFALNIYKIESRLLPLSVQKHHALRGRMEERD